MYKMTGALMFTVFSINFKAWDADLLKRNVQIKGLKELDGLKRSCIVVFN